MAILRLYTDALFKRQSRQCSSAGGHPELFLLNETCKMPGGSDWSLTNIGAYRATSIVCSVLVLCFVIFVAPSPEVHWKPFQIFPELRWNFSYIDPSPVRAILTLNSVQEHWDGSIIGACSPGLGQFVVLSLQMVQKSELGWNSEISICPAVRERVSPGCSMPQPFSVAGCCKQRDSSDFSGSSLAQSMTTLRL